MCLPKFWTLVASILDRIPSGCGIPLLVVLAVLLWIAALKLMGV